MIVGGVGPDCHAALDHGAKSPRTFGRLDVETDDGACPFAHGIHAPVKQFLKLADLQRIQRQ